MLFLLHTSGSGPFGPTAPLGGADGSGWVWAAAVLLAARLGRLTAQEARLDVRKLQFERERSRALSRDLLAARQRWQATETERAATEDARRVEEAAAKARAEAVRIKEEQRRYQEAAARESERLRLEREAQRKEYEAQQAKLDAEIAARAEQERLIIEQQRAAARAAEEQRRREEEERRRQVEDERWQREEQERLEREAAIRAKIEERRRLEREKKKFAVRLEGSLAVERPPKGTTLPGPLQKEAVVRLAASCSTLLGGAAQLPPVDYASLADAGEALPQVAGHACRQAAEAYASAMRLQSMTGEGVLQWIDDTELNSWAQAAAVRAAVAALAGGDAALATFQQGGAAATQPAAFQCRTELGVLPNDHPQRTDAVLRRVIASVESGESEAAVRQLDDLLEGQLELFQKDLPACPRLVAPAPALLGTALLLSHLLTRALAERPFATSDAPAWFEAVARLVRSKLQETAASAPKDSLQAPASLLTAVLGSGNPVAEEVARLADANVSAATRQARQERERRAAAELAAKLVEEEWPDAKEIKAARRAEEEAKTPIPERCWALRNVAGTLSMGGPGERARARQLLEQAVQLKQQFAGAPDHPGVLPELLPLAALLSSVPDWERDAGGVSALILRALNAVAADYQRQGDAVSAAILLEAALRRFEEAAGVRHPSVKATMRAADAALDTLSAEQRAAVAEARPQAEATISRLVAGLTDELGAYQQGSPVSKVERWASEGAAGVIGPLH
ncbi:apoptotic chromatin condensation inducer in the nucleus-like isoform X1 [Chlorella sorokiniana]|uniref:Apoptotic chromatin condensation inducer in the nucleus-like isoform X1 n=1 Tax=Chlorella sorokiniana TaxID=3076 RepID=A0A2P6TKS0_CHLSO|nr:apoptotic chromatin condensation inducer in the nucleus-like isoform X1 [Chlorella sorokiniana]|eukprot:PRW44890.1 apoptotic chromatin condensation inducer in the nucleus-like isoform X1 [Chlorella sorokiniana]